MMLKSWHVHNIFFFFHILGKVYFFSDGILFSDPHHGSISISKNHMSSISLYDGVSILFVPTAVNF